MSVAAVDSLLTSLAMRHRLAWTSVAAFLLGCAVFLPGIQYPDAPSFDEIHYVHTVRDYLATGVLENREHPPLAKELMAVAMWLWGDNPFGWRVMSAVLGASALAAIYLWSYFLFAEEGAALWVTAVTLVNQFLYVEARFAMLDMFVAAFIVWAMVPFTASWRPELSRQVRPLFAATGIFLGLASACKWTGVVAWLFCIATVASIKLLQLWRVRFDDPRDADWYRGDLWLGMSFWDWVVCLGCVPLSIYFVTFLVGYGPILSIATFVDMQITAWQGLDGIPDGEHPLASSFTTWPFIAHPMWFYQSEWKEVGETYTASAILLLGNPVVLWTGFLAILVCLHGWIAKRRMDALLISGMYFGLILCWAPIAHETFYFYYFPSVMTLGPALAYLFYRTDLAQWPSARRLFLAAACVSFLYFLPVSSAAVGLNLPDYYRGAWFETWKW